MIARRIQALRFAEPDIRIARIDRQGTVKPSSSSVFGAFQGDAGPPVQGLGMARV